MNALISCPHCHAEGQEALFCRSCSRYMADSTGTVEKVTYNRRFFGDDLLDALLFFATLGIGWLIWLYFTAQTAQTPAKRLVNTYVLDIETGEPISAGRVWVREVLVKILLFSVLGSVIVIADLVNSLWVFFDKNRQALHDKVVSTIVVYAPAGLPQNAATFGQGWTKQPSSAPQRDVNDVAAELRELATLHADGILTDEEYESKRSDLAKRL